MATARAAHRPPMIEPQSVDGAAAIVVNAAHPRLPAALLRCSSREAPNVLPPMVERASRMWCRHRAPSREVDCRKLPGAALERHARRHLAVDSGGAAAIIDQHWRGERTAAIRADRGVDVGSPAALAAAPRHRHARAISGHPRIRTSASRDRQVNGRRRLRCHSCGEGEADDKQGGAYPIHVSLDCTRIPSGICHGSRSPRPILANGGPGPPEGGPHVHPGAAPQYVQAG